MNNLKQLQKQEAINRLEILHNKYELMKTVIREFEQDDTVYYSEYINKNVQGILYWISNEEDYEKAIKQFEKEHNALVYHTILTHTNYGTNLTLLYVSENQDEWKNDRVELLEGLPCAYVMILDDEQSSEFGCIQIAGANGGITRLA